MTMTCNVLTNNVIYLYHSHSGYKRDVTVYTVRPTGLQYLSTRIVHLFQKILQALADSMKTTYQNPMYKLTILCHDSRDKMP